MKLKSNIEPLLQLDIGNDAISLFDHIPPKQALRAIQNH